jgi:hypothetical protein
MASAEARASGEAVEVPAMGVALTWDEVFEGVSA